MSFRIGNKRSKVKKIIDEDFDTDLDKTILLFYKVSQKEVSKDEIVLNHLNEYQYKLDSKYDKINIELDVEEKIDGFLNLKVEHEDYLIFHKNINFTDKIEFELDDKIMDNLILKIKCIGSKVIIKNINFSSTIL